MIAFKGNCGGALPRAFEKPPAGERGVLRMPSYYWEESMHPTKAWMLASINESSAAVDRGFARNLRVITNPAAHSWTRLGGAVVTLPLLAVSAVLGDLSYIMISRSSDEGWEHLRPPD